jgi:uncharacterized repeat protein (TIGR01451 family)
MQPASTASFTNGVWSGFVTVAQNATNVELHATSTQQKGGTSNPFDVLFIPLTDLALSLSVAPNPVPVTSNVTFTFAVTNHGPNAAASVFVTNPIPAGMTFVDATTTRGTVTNLNGQLVASMGALNNIARVVVTLTLRADVAGTVTNVATVHTPTLDRNPDNNVALQVVHVCDDCDHDGLPDLWEWAHGLNPNDPNDAALDADNDGLSNLQEYWAGTDPQNPNEVVRINQLVINDHDVRIQFQGMAGRKYVLERQDEVGGPWVPLVAFKLGTVNRVELVDFGAADLPSRFYRARQIP